MAAKTIKKITPPAIAPEFALHRHAMGLTSELFARVPPLFFGPANTRDFKPTDDNFRYDGLMRLPVMCYRVFEDQRNKALVLLASYEAENLIPEKNEKGQWRLPDGNRVYVVDAVFDKAFSTGRILQSMVAHDLKMNQASFVSLNLYASDITEIIKADESDQGRVVKITNGQVSYGLFEQPDGKWHVRLYVIDEKPILNEIDRFVPIDRKPPEGFFGRQVSFGQEQGDFDSFDEAFKFVFKDWAELNDNVMARSYRIWSGQSPLRDDDKKRALTAQALRTGLRQWRQHEGRIKTTMAFTALTGALLALYEKYAGGEFEPNLSFLATTVGTGILFHFRALLAEIGLEEGWELFEHFRERYLRKPFAEAAMHRLPRHYMADIENNQKRWCPKIDPVSLPYLHPVSQHKLGVAAMTGHTCTPYAKLNDADLWIATVQNKFYGSVFTPVNGSMITAHAPNGLIAVFHTCPRTHTVTTYVAHRPDSTFDSQVLVPESVLALLKEGGIIKVVHRDGKPVKRSTIDYMTFTQEMHKHVLRTNDSIETRTREDLRHIHCLFNDASGVDVNQTFTPEDLLAYPELDTPRGTFFIPHLLPDEVPQVIV